jgi:hypothetical protein
MPEDPGAPNILVKLPGSRGAGSGGATGAEFSFSASGLVGMGDLKNLVNSPGEELGGGAGDGSGFAAPGEWNIRVNSPGSSLLAGTVGPGCGAGAC